MGRLQDKISIVTGSSSGIGRAIALAIYREGGTVICADLRETARNEISAELAISTHELIIKEGGKAEFVKIDVTKAEDQARVVKHAVEKYGRLDIMVNNAGIAAEAPDQRPIWDFSEDVWNKDLAINATGVFLGCKYAAAQMMKQDPLPCGDRGWIVNTASVFGLVASRTLSGYVASKHAVMGLTKTAALDCAPHRIHVNAVCPGFTDTAFLSNLTEEGRAYANSLHPFRGLGKSEDIAKAVVFLASEDNSWATGIGLPIDGGYTTM